MMPPKLEMPEKPQTPKDDITLWGSLAIAFAGFASLRTRSPMTSALNAAGAAIQAMQQGQKEKADQAYKDWKQNVDIALELHSSEQRAYEELMNNMTHREELALKGGEAQTSEKQRADEMQLRTMTAAMRDPITWDAYTQGKAEGGVAEGVKRAAEVQKNREAQAQKIKEASASVERYKGKAAANEAMMASPEWQEAKATGNWRKMTDMAAEVEAKFAGKNGPQRMLSDEQISSMAQAVVAGKQEPPTSAQMLGARARPDGAAEWAAIHKMDPDYDPNLYKLKQQALKQLQGPDGEQIKSFTVLLHHLEFIGELGAKLQNTDQRSWNQVTNEVAKQFGMPEITNFDMAKQIVSEEAAKAIVGSQTTGGERTSLEKVFDPASSPEQLVGTVGSVKTLVAGQLSGKLSKYRKLLDKGWLTEDDVVPQETLDKYGISSIKDRSKILNPGGQSLMDRWNIQDTGMSAEDPKAAADRISGTPKAEDASIKKIPQEAAQKQAPKGATAMRQKPDGSWEYKDAQGKIIGQ